MADLVVTASLVAPVVSGTAPTFSYVAAKLTASVTAAGMILAKQTDGSYQPATATAAASIAAIMAGQGGLIMAMEAAVSGQWILGLVAGPVTVSAGSVNHQYVVSPNSNGGIAPYTDLTSGNQFATLGTIVSAGVLNFAPSYVGAFA